MLSEITVFSGL